MKKILFYTDTPLTGGAELQMFLLAKFLNKTEYSPILAWSDYPSLDRWSDKFQKEEIPVIRLKVKSKHDPQHYFQLKKIIKEHKIDLIHAHIWNPASCRYAFMAADKNTPIITTEHDPFPLPFFKDLIKKHFLKKISKIVTVSDNNAKLLKQLYPNHSKKISVIHNGLDLEWWHSQLLRFPNQDRKEIKENIFQAREDSLILITIAALHERKGLRYLIEAMHKITAKFPNTKLAIVGEGPEENELRKLVEKLEMENHVELLGRRKETPKLLKSSDVFVLPSRREAFGMVNLEAMVTGLPVVATKVGGIPEIIENGKNGFLVEPENSDALAEKILKLIKDPELRNKIGEAGYKTVVEKFDAEKMAQQYEKIYAQILST